MVEVQTLIFLSHEATNLTNDNYCSVPTQLIPQLSRLDHKLPQLNQTVNYLVVNNVKVQKTEQTLVDSDYKKAVSYLDVVSHVPTVTFHKQSQKKVPVSA